MRRNVHLNTCNNKRKVLYTTPRAYFDETARAWVLTRFSDVVVGLLDFRLTSRFLVSVIEGYSEEQRRQLQTLIQFLRDGVLFQSPPAHFVSRPLLSMALNQPNLVEDRLRRLTCLDKLPTTKEQIESFAQGLSAEFLFEILGIPKAGMVRWIETGRPMAEFLGAKFPLFEVSLAAQESLLELRKHLYFILRKKRRNPSKDLISCLLSSRLGPDRYSEQQLISQLVIMLTEGRAVLQGFLQTALISLVWDKKQRVYLEQHPEKLGLAIEEVMRLAPPKPFAGRVASLPVEIGGRGFKTGDRVILDLSLACRDSAQFSQPHQFKIDRQPNRHLALGLGLHACPLANGIRQLGSEVVKKLLTIF